MTVSRRTTIRAIAAAGGLGTVSGPVLASGRDSSEAPSDDMGAAVSVAHFSPDAPNVDVYVDDERVLADVAYGTVSEYLELQPGTYTVTITAAGDPGTVAFEGPVELDRAFYTIAAIGELGAQTFEPLVLVDVEEAPAGASLVRLVHASPDAPAVDVFADDAPLFQNASFGENTEYVEVQPGTYTLDVFPAGAAGDPAAGKASDDQTSGDDHDRDGRSAEPVASFQAELEAGIAYTVFAIGYLEPGPDVAGRDFTAVATVDGVAAGQLPDRAAPLGE